MAAPVLLQTKFLIPRWGADRLPRPHLVEWMEGHLSRRLILISAPPGYGKTTLLAEFAASTELPHAWYQVDETDSDPATFLSGIIESLRLLQRSTSLTASPSELGNTARGLLSASEVAVPVTIRRALTVLINELLEQITGDWVLVLEDVHLVANLAVHELLEILIENAPPGLHLIISTRNDPPLSLGRMRARGQLAELRATDLRFQQAEIDDWLEHTRPDISEHSARLLAEKTEGWAAGLQLALSSMTGRDTAGAEQTITELSGTHRSIFDYLAEDVFNRQSAAIQDFLKRTAVLDQMTAAACNALPGVTLAQESLASLEQNNLFVVSLDQNGEWYRYHHLFREFLLGKLWREQPDEALLLEQAAGRYFETQAKPEIALSHYLQAKDLDTIACLLARIAPEYVERGQVEAIQRYLAALPEASLRQHPELLLHFGDVHRRLGRIGLATARYQDALVEFQAQGSLAGACRALTQLAEVARSQGDYRRAQGLAEAALTQAQSEDHTGRAYALMALAKITGFLVGMDQGRELAEEAVQEARLAGEALSARSRAGLLRSLGQICWWHGDPHAAIRYCQEALQLIPEEGSPMAAEALITMATPTVYWRQLDEALKYAQRGLEIAQRLQLTELLPMAYATLGNVLTRRGGNDLPEAESYLRRAMELSQGLGLETYERVMAAGFLAFNLCAQERVEEARHVAEAALWPYAGSPDTYEVFVCRSVLADVLLETGRWEQAESLWNNLLETGRRRQFRIPLSLVYFGLGYVYLKTDRQSQAFEMLRLSLEMIEPTGAYQLFLDQGQRAREVGQLLAREHPDSLFLARVLEVLTEKPRPATILKTEKQSMVVRCLGPFRVLVDGCEIDQERWVSTKARDLFAYFITFRQERQPVERIVESLWPGAAGTRKMGFHTALYRLRQALRSSGQDPKYILVEAGEYWLEAGSFQVDVDEFDALIGKARQAQGQQACLFYEQATRLWQGEYLDNLYYDWLLPERRRLASQYLTALRSLASIYISLGSYSQALDSLQRALHIDPLLEELHCEAMRCYAQMGDRGGVARQYQHLQQVLQDELGLQPLPATQKLYQEILQHKP